eukprot:EG_transcript_11704
MPSSTGHPKSDPTVYTGLGGVAFMYFRLFLSFQATDAAQSAKFLRTCAERLAACLRLLPPEEEMVSFFCSRCGLSTLSAAVAHAQGQPAQARAAVDQVLAMAPMCARPDLADEVLFGRAGYLYCLLFLQRHANASIPRDVFQFVVEHIIQSGRRRPTAPWPAMWTCFGDPYLGAAHGVAGILYMLLLCFEALTPAQQEFVVSCCNLVLGLEVQGNFPTVLGDRFAEHVHWCHGAPGFIPLLLRAHAVLRDERFLQAAARAGECVWQRGLLRKGTGLCHGIAGNAYAFLSLYRYTHQEKYLYYAWCFCQSTWDPGVLQAIAATRDPQRRMQGVPDAPFSLMEGLAGLICFYADLLAPDGSAFPAFEL